MSRDEEVQRLMRAALEAHDRVEYNTNGDYAAMDDALSNLRTILALPEPQPDAAARAREGNWMVTVCSRCLRAACWQGKFYCDESRGASTVRLPVAALRVMALEHESFWDEEAAQRGEGE